MDLCPHCHSWYFTGAHDLERNCLPIMRKRAQAAEMELYKANAALGKCVEAVMAAKLKKGKEATEA